MKAGEFKTLAAEICAKYGEDAEIIIMENSCSGYVYDISDSYKKKEVSSLWGEDFEAVVIFEECQVGKV